MASSKRQTTMAKIAREQAVREKRARKAEKKEDKKLAAAEALLGPPEGAELEDGDAAAAEPTDETEDAAHGSSPDADRASGTLQP